MNTWSARCCAVEKANATRCTVNTGEGIYDRMNLAAEEKWRYFRPLLYTIIYSNVTSCALPYYCSVLYNTKLQPVITELMAV